MLVNACDAGREGELIFKLIYETARVDKPVRRAWFSSMTAEGHPATRSRTCATTPRCGRSRTPPAPAPRPTGWSA